MFGTKQNYYFTGVINLSRNEFFIKLKSFLVLFFVDVLFLDQDTGIYEL